MNVKHPLPAVDSASGGYKKNDNCRSPSGKDGHPVTSSTKPLQTLTTSEKGKMNSSLTWILIGLASLVAVSSALRCAPCKDVSCVPPPPGCELGRRVCSCCNECRLKKNHQCGAFTPECESHLVCYTSEGVFVGRPPLNKRAYGTCMRYEDIPYLVPTSRSG